MHSLLLLFHLVFAGIWLGCVLTEVLFERALLGQGREYELILARLHRRVDLWVEIPAFCALVVTGTWLMIAAASSALLYTKIGFGLIAVASNVYCVALVLRRASAAEQKNWSTFDRLDQRQHRWGAVVLASLLLAFGLGCVLVS